MAKKSKAKKRKIAQQRAQAQVVSATATKKFPSKVDQESAKPATQAPHKTPKSPNKSRQKNSDEVIIDNHLEITPEELKSGQTEELIPASNQPEPFNQKKLILLLGIIVLVLIGLMIYFYNQAQKATTELQQSAQDQLLNVNEASGDSLGPTTGADTANPQQPADTSQTQPSGGSDLQPQQPTTHEQLNQLQQ